MSDSNISLSSGLDAIFNVGKDTQKISDQSDNNLIQVSATDLKPSPYQPRTSFDSEKLEELAQSITENGIIQPIVVRKVGDSYEIIAGERRWRAAKIAGLTTIPVIVKDITNETALAFALIENIQRKDLNVIEEARAYQRLLNELNFSHEEIANRVGKSRPHITNMLRLLNLSPTIHVYLEKGIITMGHARALLTLSEEQQLKIVQQVVKHSLSVRETERAVQRINMRPTTTKDKELPCDLNQKLCDWKLQLSKKLPSKSDVYLDPQEKGRFVIHFSSVEEADTLIEALLKV